MCLGNWSKQGMVPNNVMKAASKLPDVLDTDEVDEDEYYEEVL